MQSFHLIAHTGEGLWSIDLLFNLVWKSSLLSIAILALSKSLVARRAQWVWRIGLLGFIAIFLFCSSSLWEIQTYAPASVSPAKTLTSQIAQEVHSQANPSYSVAPTPPKYAKLSKRFDAILTGIWFIGFTIIIGKALLEFFLLRYASQKANAYDSRFMEIGGIQLTQQLGLATPPKVLISNSIPIPITYGWKKPIILLPALAINWEKERLLQVLLHELVHIQRNDYLFNLLAIKVKALFWFNPLTYPLLQQFRLNREWACDERVIALGTDKFTYAKNLLAIAALGEARQKSQLALSFTRSHSLVARIQRVLAPKSGVDSPSRYRFVPTLILLLLSIMMLSTNLRTIADKPYSATTYDQTIQSLQTADDTQKIKSLQQLGQWGRRTSFRQVKPFALDPNLAVRMKALSALQQIACLPAFCLISQQLQDQDQVIKQHADTLLDTYPSSKLQAYLLDYLKEPSMENWFIQYFQQIRDIGQTERLAIHLSEGKSELRSQIQQHLMNPQQAGALAQLEKLLQN